MNTQALIPVFYVADVDEVDLYFEQITIMGAAARSTPQDRAYGMQDFAVLDPDGNQLTFGCCTE